MNAAELQPVSDLQRASEQLALHNPAQADFYLRRYLLWGGAAPAAAAIMARIEQAYGLSPGFKLCEAPPLGGRFLWIKAWGYGFWSDVHHALGQLLLAELTHRTPIIEWGSSSLFGEGSDDAFRQFFLPVSPLQLAQLPADLTVYPQNWTRANLHTDNSNKWTGPHARQAAPFLFQRSEDLVVNDFYMTLAALIPWIGPESRYFGQSEDQLYSLLFAKYLQPQPAIEARVNAFYQARMAGRHWVAVHLRGADKIHESADLQRTNQAYAGFVDRIIELNPDIGVFLLTDSVEIERDYSQRYGARLVTTAALRSDNDQGVHYQGHDGRRLGEEVLIDALLAARCDYFVGNQESNVSVAISSLKNWPAGQSFLLGGANIRVDNEFLHNLGESPVSQACRLCGGATELQFERQLLSQYRVKYLRCSSCESLQTESPHWLAEAAARQSLDPGQASRTLAEAMALPQLLRALNISPSDSAVDCGGGSGLLARLLRDAGYNFHAFDSEGSGEFTAGYNWQSLQPCRLITMFDVAQRFAEPAQEWQKIFAADPEWVIGSSAIFAGQGAEWELLRPETGRQVFFQSAKGLALVAASAGRHAYLCGRYFLITRAPLDAAALAAAEAWQADLKQACTNGWQAWSLVPGQQAQADLAALTAYARLQATGQRIVVDGVFFRFAGGIARVWQSLLGHWANSELASQLLIIDRGRSAPRWPGFQYIDAPHYDYANPVQDRILLQAICNQHRAALFISTYYTIPLTTPSALLVLDMIPEVLGWDLTDPQWLGKRQAIDYARAFISISHNTDRDLLQFHPALHDATRMVSHCGCDMRAAGAEQIAAFKAKYGIERPYFLIAGAYGGQKNGELFFKAFERFGAARGEFAVICTNADQALNPEAARQLGAGQLHLLVLSEEDLQCAYSGALALAYPSRYEGFGMPPVEAMACACPVITCRNSSLSEVAGDAAIYVDPDSVEQMHRALLAVQQPELRASLIREGMLQAQKFSWRKMADEIGSKLAEWAVNPPSR